MVRTRLVSSRDLAARPAPPSLAVPAAAEDATLTLMTHDSFYLPEGVIEAFEAEHGVERRSCCPPAMPAPWSTRPSSPPTAPRRRALRRRQHVPLARARGRTSSSPTQSAALAAVPAELQLDPQSRVTPIDVGARLPQPRPRRLRGGRPALAGDARGPGRPGPGGTAGGRRTRPPPRPGWPSCSPPWPPSARTGTGWQLLDRPARQRRDRRGGLGGGLLRPLLRCRRRRGRAAHRRLVRLQPGGRGHLRRRPRGRGLAHRRDRGRLLRADRVRGHPAWHRSARAGRRAHRLPARARRSRPSCPLAMFVYPARSDVALPEAFEQHALVPAAPRASTRRSSTPSARPGSASGPTSSCADAPLGPAAGGPAAGVPGPLLPVAGGQHPGPRHGARRPAPARAACSRRGPSRSCSTRSLFTLALAGLSTLLTLLLGLPAAWVFARFDLPGQVAWRGP